MTRTKIKIYPYKLGSESARSLAQALDTVCVKPDGKYKYYSNHIILNWGNSDIPKWFDRSVRILNHPLDVAVAVNKLETLRHLVVNAVPTVEWTTSFSLAKEWIDQGETVVERHNLTGSKGDGIRIVNADSDDEIALAPLYTKLIGRAREYRVHVFNGEVIDVQQKKRREGNDSDGTIKNVDNGWVFVRDEITTPPRSIFDVAVRSVVALGLDFGAVDILTKDGNCYVLEVNTACGLEGSTITSYVNAIKKYASNK